MELIDKLKEYLTKKKKPYLKQIMSDLELEEYQVYGLIEMLKKSGYTYEIIDGKILKTKPVKESGLYRLESNLDHLKLLLISDTHLGSKFDRIDILNYLYDEADKKNIDYVLMSGDLCEGLSGRPQQLTELKPDMASYTGQRDYVIEKYPKWYKHTYFIAGNHDLWWIKQCGADICRDISNQREDLVYLGSDCEDMKIGKLRIRLFHGTGGNAYAKSYKLQKYLDSIDAEERPHILQTGHIHQAFYMKQGNTHCFQTSCLQDLTPYARSKGLSNDKSVWWVDVYHDDKGNPVKISQQLETFGKKLIRKR